ncbi:MAG: c-type cytochrome domain-containing protein [Verrucomicrobiota bacterium]
MKLSSLLAFGVVLGISSTVAQAELGDASKLPPAAKKAVSFAKDIKPLLDKSCVECHKGEKPKGKYKMDSGVAAIIKGGSSGDAAIIPGNSAKSPLVHYAADLVTDMEMPPTDKRDKYPALTKDQIGLIRAWIDAGAKE